MKCTGCGAYVSGDHCGLCGTILRIKEPEVSKIESRSEKGKAEDIIYKDLRLKFLKKHPRCMVYPWLKAIEIHHKKGRGKYYLDTSTWMAVSRKAHEEIEANPEWAKERGYSLERLNDQK
jgi:hypothetical protein